MEPLELAYGRKIRTLLDTKNPLEIYHFFSYYGRGCIRNPLHQKHIIQVMIDYKYTAAHMAKTTGLSASTLGKWKKRHCPKSPGKLYILVDERQGAFKVGITRRTVEKRVKDLQTALASDIKVFLSVDSLNPEKIEELLHGFLSSKGKHINREWFKLDTDSKIYLSTLRKLRNDGMLDDKEFANKWAHERIWTEEVGQWN